MTNWKSHGLACRVVESDFGTLCGYVGVPQTHPLFGEDYLADAVLALEVHGGVTFSGPWEEDGPWWFGFDTMHAGDDVPRLGLRGARRDEDFVRLEVEKLAEQLAKLGAS